MVYVIPLHTISLPILSKELSITNEILKSLEKENILIASYIIFPVPNNIISFPLVCSMKLYLLTLSHKIIPTPPY